MGTTYCQRDSEKFRHLCVGKKGLPGAVSQQSLWSQGDFFFFFFWSLQSATDIGQIQELQLQLEEAKKEKHKLQEQVCAQCRHIVGEEEKGSLRDLTLWVLETVIHSFIHSLNFSPVPNELTAILNRHTLSLPVPVQHPKMPRAMRLISMAGKGFLPLRNGSKEMGCSAQDRTVVLCETSL